MEYILVYSDLQWYLSCAAARSPTGRWDAVSAVEARCREARLVRRDQHKHARDQLQGGVVQHMHDFCHSGYYILFPNSWS